MFRTRLLSGIVLIIVMLAVILAGGGIMAGALCAISIIAFLELTKATGVHTQDMKINGLEMTGVILILLYYTGLYVRVTFDNCNETELYSLLIANIVLFFLVLMFFYVFSFPKFKAGQVMAVFFELIYAPVLLSFLYIIREGWQWGYLWVWLVFICSWGSDTCAYCVGVLFGKHKMTPKLSPKKSIEGAIGGVIGAALLFSLYNYLVGEWLFPSSGCVRLENNHVVNMCIGAVGALISMIGDLAASGIKRDYGIKDYGKLIPGHGGIMDRFDSVIIVAPFIYFVMMIL